MKRNKAIIPCLNRRQKSIEQIIKNLFKTLIHFRIIAQACYAALLWLCLSANISAQTYEFTTVLPLDKLLVEDINDTLSAFFPLKYVSENSEYHNEFLFSSTLLEEKRNAKWFYDSKLQKPIGQTYDEYVDYPDTIIRYNPETNEEQIQLRTFCDWTFHIKSTAIRHILTYNPKNQAISCEIAALAPMMKRRSDIFKTDYFLTAWTAHNDTLYGENVNFQNTALHHFTLSDTTLTWAKMAKINIKTTEFERINTNSDFVTALYNDIKQGKWQAYTQFGDSLSSKSLNLLLNAHTQTEQVFDSQTYKYKEVSTQTQGFGAADCTHLQLSIVYFFDAKRFRLGCRVDSIRFVESKGNIVFYIKPLVRKL